MTLTLLKRGEDKRAILNQWPTERAAILRARERRLVDWREGVARLKTLVAQKAEQVTAPVVRAALGHNIHDPARCASEFRGKGISDYLKLLHSFLADRGARRVD